MAERHVHLTTFEWYDGPGAAGQCWRAPGGKHRGLLDLRTLEQCATKGGEAGFCLAAFDAPRSGPGTLYLGDGLDRPLSTKQRDELRGMLGIGEVPSANLREFVGHLFTLYVDPTGKTSRKPQIGGAGRPVKLTFGGQTVFRANPNRSVHRANALAVFQADYARAKRDRTAWIQQRSDAFVRIGRPALDAIERAHLGAQYDAALAKWAGGATIRFAGKLDPVAARAVLPSAHRNDPILHPESTVIELWLTTDTSTIATGQSQPHTEKSGDWVTNEEEIGGGPGGAHFTMLQTDTSATFVSQRCDTAVSSEDHKITAITAFMATPDGNKLASCCTRYHASDETFMAFGWIENAGDNAWLDKVVTGTRTNLEQAPAPTPGLSDNANDRRHTIEGESSGGNHSWRHDDTDYITDFSDSSITGNLRSGSMFYDNVTRACSHQTMTFSDLVVYVNLRWTATVSEDASVTTVGAGTAHEALSDDDPDSYVHVT